MVTGSRSSRRSRGAEPAIAAAPADSDRHPWEFALLVERSGGKMSHLSLVMFEQVVASIDTSEVPAATVAAR